MGFFDTVKGKAGALAADTERAGKVTAAQARLVVLQNDLKKAERELGHAAYALAERGELDHPDLAHAIERLRATTAEVHAKEAEIAALRGEAAPADTDDRRRRRRRRRRAHRRAEPAAAAAARGADHRRDGHRSGHGRPRRRSWPPRPRRPRPRPQPAAARAGAPEPAAADAGSRPSRSRPGSPRRARPRPRRRLPPRRRRPRKTAAKADAEEDRPQGRRHPQEVDAALVGRAAPGRQEAARRLLSGPGGGRPT